MHTIKTKTEAKAIFGSNLAMAQALGISPGALSQWPDELTKRQQNEVMGALHAAGLLPTEKDRRKRRRAGTPVAGAKATRKDRKAAAAGTAAK